MKTVNINQHSWHYWVAHEFIGWKHSKKVRLPLYEATYTRKTVIVEYDFCSYVRAVSIGVIFLGAIFLGLSLIVSAMAYSAYFSVHMFHLYGITLKLWPYSEFVYWGFGFWSLLCLILVGITLSHYWDNIVDILSRAIFCVFKVGQVLVTFVWSMFKRTRDTAEDDSQDPKESFVTTAYLSLKDKVCFRINIIDNSQSTTDKG